LALRTCGNKKNSQNAQKTFRENSIALDSFHDKILQEFMERMKGCESMGGEAGKPFSAIYPNKSVL